MSPATGLVLANKGVQPAPVAFRNAIREWEAARFRLIRRTDLTPDVFDQSTIIGRGSFKEVRDHAFKRISCTRPIQCSALAVSLSLYLFLSRSLSISLSLSLSLGVSLSHSVSLSLRLSLCVSVRLRDCVCVCVCLSVCLSHNEHSPCLFMAVTSSVPPIITTRFQFIVLFTVYGPHGRCA